jgi:hypothetical protein
MFDGKLLSAKEQLVIGYQKLKPLAEFKASNVWLFTLTIKGFF